MNKVFIYLLILSTFRPCFLIAEKYALIVAISDYGQESGFSTLHCDNDIMLIRDFLPRYGFAEANITVLQNTDATIENIRSSISNIRSRMQAGDIFYFHFSGHGQRFWDENRDEINGWDESLVCYGAKNKYEPEGYTGSSHLVDDEIAVIIDSLRKQAGASGSVFFTVDACYSGEVHRGNRQDETVDTSFCRDSDIDFAPSHYKPFEDLRMKRKERINNPEENNKAKFAMISASTENSRVKEICLKSGSKNSESIYVGPLSYSIHKVLSIENPPETFRALFEQIIPVMKFHDRRHEPVFEGDTEVFIFSGKRADYVKFYGIAEHYSNDLYKINAGEINRFDVGTLLGVYPAGSLQPEGDPAAVLEIDNVMPFESTARIIKGKLEENKLSSYRVFLKENKTKHELAIKYYSEAVSLKELSGKNSKFKKVNSAREAELLFADSISVTGDTFIIGENLITGHRQTFKKPKHANFNNDIIISFVEEQMMLKFLRNINLQNPDYKVECFIKNNLQKINTVEKSPIYLRQNTKFEFCVKNSGEKEAYYYLIVFYDDGSADLIAPTGVGDIRKLIPVDTGSFSFVMSADKKGIEKYKIIASDRKLSEIESFFSEATGKSRGTVSLTKLIDKFEEGVKSGNAQKVGNIFTSDFIMVIN